MRSSHFLSATLFSLFLSSPVLGSEIVFSASIGSSTYSYDYTYPYENQDGDDDTYEFDEEIDFDYQDFAISYAPDAESSWTLKIGGLPKESDYAPYYSESSAERNETSITYTKKTNENWSWFGGYYSSDAQLRQSNDLVLGGVEYEFDYDTSIETGGFFLGATHSDILSDNLFWYGRGAVQLNWTTFEDNWTWEDDENDMSGGEPFSKDLTGVAVLFGIGLFYPLNDTFGINLGYEYKSYDYDNEEEYLLEGTTSLSEDQDSLILTFTSKI